MKKIFFMASALSIMITQTGCFGSFGLVKTVYEFNAEITDNDVIRTVLMYVLMIVPVYQAAGFLDIVIFNLIEFWTGSNPIAMKDGQIEEQLLTIKGETYKVTATKNKMAFVKFEEGIAVDMGAMIFEESDKSWSFEKEGESTKLASFDTSKNVVNFFTENGIRAIDAKSVENLAMNNMNRNNSIVLASN